MSLSSNFPSLRLAADRLAEAWFGRTERERWLLGGLGVLIAGLVLWYGLWTPLQAWSRSAQTRYADASAELAEAEGLAARIRQVEQTRSQGAAVSPEAVRSAAAAAGLTIVRDQPDGTGLHVWTEPAPAASVFAWLLGLQRDRGAAVRSLELRKGESGGVQAQAVIGGGT